VSSHNKATAALLALLAMGCSDAEGSIAPTDAGNDSDTDSDTDSDNGSDTDDDGCAAGGNWYDQTTSLCWQDPPSEEIMDWYAASGEADDDRNPGGAADYCGDLVAGGFDDWRLPALDELLSLMRGCVDGEATGDLSHSECTTNPPECSSTNICDIHGDCDYCSYMNGPGSGGCFWDPDLDGPCESYWSSSPSNEYNTVAWYILFHSAYVQDSNSAFDRYVRCVRGGS